MKLTRLVIDNWRGVEHCEISFSDEVTLIEGPNEIGKSTIVEALQILIEVMDSSNKTNIKAIQPIGQDVGSRVEAEITSGDYHFVYSKTYNKDKQTELHILAPKLEQLTGREAHERVEQLLESTVDMTLWKALLLEQGKEITAVQLSESNGLAKALDEAAGGISPEQDDSDLYSYVQAEYEQYYSLKAGKFKHSALEKKCHEADILVEEAHEALEQVEADSNKFERCSAEINRLNKELPNLSNNVKKRQDSWDAVNTLQQQVNAKQSQLSSEKELLQAATVEQERRQRLADELLDSNTALEKKNAEIEPLAIETKNLKADFETAEVKLKEDKINFRQARTALELVHLDEQHLKDLLELAAENKRSVQLKDINIKTAQQRSLLTAIKISASGLEELRDSERDLQIASSQLDASSSSIEITTEQKLTVDLNDEALEIAEGDTEQRNFASELKLNIPGVASIRIIPSQSAAELEAEVAESRLSMEKLLQRFGVTDLADAIATEAKGAAATRDLKSWTDKLKHLLDDDTETEVVAKASELNQRCDDYIKNRVAKPSLPEDSNQASTQATAAASTVSAYEKSVELQQDSYDQLREDYTQSNADHRLAQQEVAGLKQTVINIKNQLDDNRKDRSDDTVNTKVNERTAIVETLKEALDTLVKQLDSAAPEVATELLDNAKSTYQRAERELLDNQTDLAVLEDRLSQAQANGRFETLQSAIADAEVLELSFKHTLERAEAAKLLWTVLSKLRDETRKTYLLPLKNGIEQLGKIVFGSDFAIDLNDDWTLLSRTLNGKLICFDDLSVGAREQLGILTRLAAAKIISTQEGVPLIIDDALGFSDPLKLETMGAAIAAAGKDTQIIILTCTPGRFTHVGNAQVVRL